MIEEEEIETKAQEAVEELASKFIKAAAPIWHWGDGFGGGAIAILIQAAQRNGLSWGPRRPVRKGPTERYSANKYLREEVIARDGLQCTYCKTSLKAKDATMDHRVPFSAGGKTTIENLCVCCKSCNSRKGKKLGFPSKLETLQ